MWQPALPCSYTRGTQQQRRPNRNPSVNRQAVVTFLVMRLDSQRVLQSRQQGGCLQATMTIRLGYLICCWRRCMRTPATLGTLVVEVRSSLNGKFEILHLYKIRRCTC